MADEKKTDIRTMTRKEFLKGLGTGIVGGGLAVAGVISTKRVLVGTGTSVKTALPPSTGYVLVDSQKCAGCRTCMMACSLVHEGQENLSLSRIQILNNPLGHYPSDIVVKQCRQCVYPACVIACSTGALHVDAKTGVRMVDEDSCIGCQRCVEACPHMPGRVEWNAADGTSAKCDLCIDAKYLDGGGPGGKQACVAVCPMKAITFSSSVPAQMGVVGYEVDLRSANYRALTVPTVRNVPPPARPEAPAAPAAAAAARPRRA